MAGPYRTLGIERLYESVHCALRRDRVAFPGGGRGVHHVIEIPDAAIVVPVLDDGRIVLLKQYRYAPRRSLWEVPAGRIHRGESARQAARRECEEESGWRPRRLEGGRPYFPLAGISSHRAYTFVARDLVHSRTRHERTESIEVHTFGAEEVRRMIRGGEIREGFSIVALARYFLAEEARRGSPSAAASRRRARPGRRPAPRRAPP
ncbi:MAG: NUDIX hydrolase [Planctomycetes bacterium]|nr:NUDIX hydrolase [Planctomycetota bacterium]